MADRSARSKKQADFHYHEEIKPDYSDAVISIVHAQWHEEIVERLVAGANRCAKQFGVVNVITTSVPGCFELARACQSMANQGYVNAVVALGVIVRGETVHFDLVSQGAANGIMRVQLDTKVPIGLGILAVENEQQALDRSQDDDEHNVGFDAMEAALIMINYDEAEIDRLVRGVVAPELTRAIGKRRTKAGS